MLLIDGSKREGCFWPLILQGTEFVCCHLRRLGLLEKYFVQRDRYLNPLRCIANQLGLIYGRREFRALSYCDCLTNSETRVAITAVNSDYACVLLG